MALANIKVEGKKITFGIDDPNVSVDPQFDDMLDETGAKISVLPEVEYLTKQVLHWWEAGQKVGTSIIIRNNGTVPIYYIY